MRLPPLALLCRLLTTFCVAGLLLPASAGAAATDDPAEELQDVRDRLDGAREGLSETQRRQAVTLEDLAEAETRRAELENRLADLEGELTGAEGDLAAAEDRLARTTDQIAATSRRLEETRARLEADRERFAQRARQVYKHGRVDATSALTLDAGETADVQRALGYMESVLATDRRELEQLGNLQTRVAQEVEELDRLEARQLAAREEAEAERDYIAYVVGEQRDTTAAAATEAERHADILVQLESDTESSQQLIASLELDSQQLEEELQRRVAEAEQRRAAESARQAAAAEQQRQVAAAQGTRPGPGTGNAGPVVAPSLAQAPAAPASSGRFQLPASGRLSSPFGYRVHPISRVRKLHTGQDISAPSGSPIYAAESGVVVSAGWRGGYGNATVVDHGAGVATLYAHQSRFAVRAGQHVARGQLIGYVGSTGYSTGPHLHFEVRVNGSPTDPAPYL